MLDGNVLLRQKRDEVLKGTLSCPYRNMADNNKYGYRTGLCLHPSLYTNYLFQRYSIKTNLARSNPLRAKILHYLRHFLHYLRVAMCSKFAHSLIFDLSSSFFDIGNRRRNSKKAQTAKRKNLTLCQLFDYICLQNVISKTSTSGHKREKRKEEKREEIESKMSRLIKFIVPEGKVHRILPSGTT